MLYLSMKFFHNRTIIKQRVRSSFTAVLLVSSLLSSQGVVIRDTVAIKPATPRERIHILSSSPSPSCYTTYWSINGNAILIPKPHLFFETADSTFVTVLDCPEQWEGVFNGPFNGIMGHFHAMTSCAVPDGEWLVEPVSVPLQPGELDGKELWVDYGGTRGRVQIGEYHIVMDPESINLMITNPLGDTTVDVGESQAPSITMQETHSDSSTTIFWFPGQTINTADYLPQMTANALTITVQAIAVTKCGNTDSVSRHITLRRQKAFDHFDVYAAPDTLQQGDVATLHVVAKSSDGDTVFIVGSTPVTLQAGPQNAGWLWAPSGDDVVTGTQITVPYSTLESGSAAFLAWGESPSSAIEIPLTVYEADNPQKSGTGTIIVAASPDHFAISMLPDTISHTDTARVMLQAKDAQGNDIPFSDNALLSYSIQPVDTYLGDLYYVDQVSPAEGRSSSRQSTLKTDAGKIVLKKVIGSQDRSSKIKSGETANMAFPEKLATKAKSALEKPAFQRNLLLKKGATESLAAYNLTYGQARSGNLYFIADGSNPDQPTPLNLTIQWQNDESKTGTGTMMLDPTCMSIIVTPSVLSPGDTAVVNILQRKIGGGLVPYGLYDYFEISFPDSESGYGTLIKTDDWRGNDLNVVQPPMRFIAAQQITGDSVTVHLRAAVAQGGAEVAVKTSSHDSVLTRNLSEKTARSPSAKAGKDAEVKQMAETSFCGDATATIIIKKGVSCPVVTLSPQAIVPGDTSDVIIRGKIEGDLGNVHYVDYPSGQLFNVRIIAGGEYGDLLEVQTGTRADTLTAASLPIRFIAAHTISGDSAVFTIRAVPVSAPPSSLEKTMKAPKSVRPPKRTFVEQLGGACTEPVAEGTITNIDHFDITLERNPVAYTEDSRVYVKAMSKEGTEINLDNSTLLVMQLDGDFAYGTFIKPNGEIVGIPREQNGEIIRNPQSAFYITYGNARQGLAKFSAIGANPKDFATPKIVVALNSNYAVQGTKDITVVEQTLKIVMDVPLEVRPSIPTEDRDNAMVDLRQKLFKVQMTRNKEAVSNHPFRLWTNYVDQSGGHDHGDTRNVRRQDTDDNFGYFTIGQDMMQMRPLDGVTDANGQCEVTYHASIFGDTMKIYLKSTDPNKENFLKDSIAVVEKVNGLLNFRNITPYSEWTLLQSDQGIMRHSDNNWCTLDFADSVKAGIDDFYDWSMSQADGKPAVILSLNDMSLQFGGRFDISGVWDLRYSQQHLFHRIGTSVDVNPNDGNNRVLNNDQLDQLGKLMELHHLFRNGERPQIHFGFTKGN